MTHPLILKIRITKEVWEDNFGEVSDNRWRIIKRFIKSYPPNANFLFMYSQSGLHLHDFTHEIMGTNGEATYKPKTNKELLAEIKERENE